MRWVLLVALVAALPACSVSTPRQEWEREAIRATGGNPDRGKKAIQRYGCTSCHTIPGLPGDANVGPPLQRVGSRAYIAGVLVNTPDNMKRWIKDPPAVDPKTAMPKLGVEEQDVKDIACYLYTQR